MMRRRWLLAGAVALLAGGAILAGRGGEAGHEGDVAGRAAAYAERIGLRLPAGTRAGFAYWWTGLDDAARIALVMPDAGWAAFRAGLPRGRFGAEGNHRFEPDEAGWAPGRAAGLTSAQFPWHGPRGGTEALNVGVAPAGPGERRVFVFWHQL